jgi:hypothetical protein
MLRFWRSTYDVLIWSGSGRPRTTVRSVLSRDRRAVALLRFRRDAVVLDQDRVVDSSIKSRVYGIQVDVVSIRRELNAIRQTAREVRHEMLGGFGVARPDIPGRNELCISAKRGPCPDIAINKLSALLRWHVLLVRVHEGPSLVRL